MKHTFAHLSAFVVAIAMFSLFVGCDRKDAAQSGAPAERAAATTQPAAIVPEAPAAPAVVAEAPAAPAAPQGSAFGAPLERFAAYPVPFVTLVETEDGKAMRVRIKESLANIEMVKIPAGSVEMPMVLADGTLDATSTQKVPIKAFWMSKTEVPWDIVDPWRFASDLSSEEEQKLLLAEDELPKAARSRPSRPYDNPCLGYGRDGFAVINLHYNAAEMYCRWLSTMTGKKYRLPTEAEWEYACRAGGPAEKLSAAALNKIAWFRDNSEHETGDLRPQPVGQKEPNAFGLHDMLGNVGEWVIGIDGQYVLKGGWFSRRAGDIHPRTRDPYNESIWQLRNPQDPKSAWWLSDAPFAGFRLVRDE